ncbi:hypothetical protein JI667_14750 [Bacillus sp. NTK074B]|uniref:hypothetical protein n=1 Tax=Bacillus sp. NTK074B TaxID=2802174 RepID=UPI001A8DCA34|nr:hypothetical protein [Bacillus sp. NTK074B]
MKKINKKVIGIALTSFLVSGLSYVYLYKPNDELVTHAKFAMDIYDENEVVDFAEDVAVAKVLEKNSVKEDGLGVYTPYTVEIDSIVKGKLQPGQEIQISQRIGYDNKEKKHIKLTENDQYLEVGNTYIFSLTYDDRENIYRIVAPETGNTKVKELKEKKIDKEIVGKFQKAARE